MRARVYLRPPRGGQPRTSPPSANAGRKPELRDRHARPGADALLPAGQAPPGRALSLCPPPEGTTPAQVLAERERCGDALPSVWTRWASGGSSRGLNVRVLKHVFVSVIFTFRVLAKLGEGTK